MTQRTLILDFSNNTNATSETNYDNVQFLPLKDLLLGAGYHVAALLAPAGDGAIDDCDLEVPPKKYSATCSPRAGVQARPRLIKAKFTPGSGEKERIPEAPERIC